MTNISTSVTLDHIKYPPQCLVSSNKRVSGLIKGDKIPYLETYYILYMLKMHLSTAAVLKGGPSDLGTKILQKY